MRDAMQAVHDRTVELMNAGADVHTAMRDVRVPEHLDVGEGYGKTSWNVRAIWEMYAGWFQHRSTTELYGVAPHSVAGDVRQRRRRRRARRGGPRPRSPPGAPVQALHLDRPGPHRRARAHRGPRGRRRARTRRCSPTPRTSGRRPGSPNRSTN